MLKNKYILLFSGWIFSRLILSLFRDIKFGIFILEPGIISICIVVFLMLIDVNSKYNVRNFSTFLIGVVADSLIYSLIRQGNDILPVVNSPWENIVWLYSIASLIFVFIVYFLIKKIDINSINKKKYYYLIGLFCFITVVLFRFFYFLTIDLPNNERSTILLGIEVHHLAYGTVSIILFSALRRIKIIFESIYLSILFGISVGMVLDQVIYLLLLDVSDKSYNSVYSWAGAVAFTFLYINFIFYIAKKDNICLNMKK